MVTLIGSYVQYRSN